MKRSSYQSMHAVAHAVASAALFAVIAFGPGVVFAAKGSGEARVEAQIAEMHAKLKITPAQEEQWTKVAAVMRENAKSLDGITRSRLEHAKTMTAVDDLKSYAEITEAHLDGIKRLTPVFAALYADMPDAQKKEADAVFRRVGQNTPKRK
ncbi:MAG TPA: Spy/CpxP family protein refolding chaperone [Burkholderiales bacterium]